MRRFFERGTLWLAVLALAAANVFIWYAVFPRAGVLTVSFLDVGQGDAIYIEAPNGRQMLVDGGAGPAVLRELGEVMVFGDRSIDAVIGTHPDKDHIGGLAGVLSRYDVGVFVDPGMPNDTIAWRVLEEEIVSRGVPRKIARRGMRIDMGSGVIVDVLSPERTPRGADTNSASIITKISYGESSFLLTGDAPKKIEERLIALDGVRLESDVLKAGHHGSRTSTSERFLAAVAPSLAVISSGEGNSYGHPHKEVLNLLEAHGVRVLRTDESGRVTFTTDGRTVKLSL